MIITEMENEKHVIHIDASNLKVINTLASSVVKNHLVLPENYRQCQIKLVKKDCNLTYPVAITLVGPRDELRVHFTYEAGTALEILSLLNTLGVNVPEEVEKKLHKKLNVHAEFSLLNVAGSSQQ